MLNRKKCPFCGGNYFVTLDNEFHCLRCGRKGNENSFRYFQGLAIPDKTEKKDELFSIYKETAMWYFLNLRNYSSKCRGYYVKRGLSNHTITSFGLGYAPKYGLEKHLKLKGFSERDIVESQLVCVADDGRHYDFFRNRAMIPILNEEGYVVAFGGRALESDCKVKYINSRESELFNKTNLLFAYNFAKNSSREGMICCEGYMDAIAMHQYGFDNAVASLGTSFTLSQAKLISEHTNKVWLAYDSDEAGQKATEKNLEMLRRVNINARVVDLSPYKDPDEFLKNAGALEFDKRLYQAEDGILYSISKMDNKKDIVKLLYPLLSTLEQVEYYVGLLKKSKS